MVGKSKSPKPSFDLHSKLAEKDTQNKVTGYLYEVVGTPHDHVPGRVGACEGLTAEWEMVWPSGCWKLRKES